VLDPSLSEREGRRDLSLFLKIHPNLPFPKEEN
jgi:hypothetical protein